MFAIFIIIASLVFVVRSENDCWASILVTIVSGLSETEIKDKMLTDFFLQEAKYISMLTEFQEFVSTYPVDDVKGPFQEMFIHHIVSVNTTIATRNEIRELLRNYMREIACKEDVNVTFEFLDLHEEAFERLEKAIIIKTYEWFVKHIEVSPNKDDIQQMWNSIHPSYF
jgi:hypothetical protein